VGGAIKEGLIRAQKPISGRISCKGQSTGHAHTHTTAEHTTAEQTTHANTERATAQRRLIVEVVVAALKIVVVRFAAERRPLALERRGVASPDFRPV